MTASPIRALTKAAEGAHRCLADLEHAISACALACLRARPDAFRAVRLALSRVAAARQEIRAITDHVAENETRGRKKKRRRKGLPRRAPG